MTEIDRRRLVASFALASASVLAGKAAAQQPATAPAAPASNQPPAARFGYEDVTKRARELAGAAFVPVPPLGEPLSRIDAEAWGDIRFRADKALFPAITSSSAFRPSIWAASIASRSSSTRSGTAL